MTTLVDEMDEYDWRFAIYSAVALLILLASFFAALWFPRTPSVSPVRALSSVIVSDPTGHGSGVHIGHGFILTAAHVVDGHADMTVTDSDGHKQSGLVMWSNKDYDVALLRVDDPSRLATTPLSCDVRPKIGDEIQAIGNPVNLQFIHAWGRVASVTAERDPWKMSVIADMTIAPGMSGGGVFDKAGNLVGLAVGVASNGPVIFAISYIVPIQAACVLMGRN